MGNTKIIRVVDDKTPAELRELLVGAFKENPDKKGLQELKKILENHPELWHYVCDLGEVVRERLIDKIFNQKAAQLGLKANITDMQRGMGYVDGPTLERLLIDNIINAWLCCQWTEYQLSSFTGEVRFSEIGFWEKRLSLSQARYLRACETLTRVRKLARNTPALQVNIAAEGGQQVNISGELSVQKADETSNRR